MPSSKNISRFEAQLKRAKEVLGVETDKDFSELLGINHKTFSRHRKNEKFPDMELHALSNKRPELKIDFDYIVTGIPASEFDRCIADAGISSRAEGFLDSPPLSDEEKLLIRAFRICDRSGKDAGLKVLQALAYQREYAPRQGSQRGMKVRIDNAGQVVHAESATTVTGGDMHIGLKGNKNDGC